MKIIKNEENKSTIILDNEDELEIKALKGNKAKVIVKCINSIIHIDELTDNDSILINEEKKAIKLMKDYLQDNEDK